MPLKSLCYLTGTSKKNIFYESTAN